MTCAPELSVVVPLYNEEESVAPLVDAVRGALGDGTDWELILVDDGSTDATARIAADLSAADTRVRLVRLARNYGQTPAMQAGFDHARGRIVVSMDGDLQNDPLDIPCLVARLEEGYDLVAGYRVNRQDRLLTRKVPSWFANRIIAWITGVRIRDNGCSLKAYRGELLRRLHLYSDMHRFIPAVAAATVGARITELPVRHHPRRYGRSKYGLSRTVKVLLDLLILMMIRSFRERPLLLFAIGAVAAAAAGAVFTAAVVAVYILFPPQQADGMVLPAAALLWYGLGVYLLILGLIAETAVGESRRRQAAELPVAREVAW